VATTAGIGISAATLIDVWHATRKATQAVTMDEYQAVKQIVTDGQNNVEVLAVIAEVAERYEAVPYPEIKDPFDRIIVATAWVARLPLVTADSAIRASGGVEGGYRPPVVVDPRRADAAWSTRDLGTEQRWHRPASWHTMSHVGERISWDDAATDHIRTRSARYPAAADIDPAWTVEVVHDPDRLVDEPDPRSAHINSVRIVGYSPTGTDGHHRRCAARPVRRVARCVRVAVHGRRAAPVPGGQMR